MGKNKPKILFAWEHGANFGHVSILSELIKPLIGRADIYVAAADVVAMRKFSPHLPVTLLQAPQIKNPANGIRAKTIHSYADDIAQCGWADANALAALMEAWRNLFDLVAPDIVISHAAPTANLTAHSLGIKSVMVANGYGIPPQINPLPIFRHWAEKPEDIALMQKNEKHICTQINEVLSTFSADPIHFFWQIFKADLQLLTTWPEIDHYGQRTKYKANILPYRGPLISHDVGVSMDWLPQKKYRIFGYLRSGDSRVPMVIDALRRLPNNHDIILTIPNAPPELEDRIANTSIRLSRKPIKLNRLLANCDLGISHASHGVSAGFIQYGVRQIAIPTHTEQMMIARALVEHKMGYVLQAAPNAKAIEKLILHCLTNQEGRAHAAKIGAKYQAIDLDINAKNMADKILALLN